MLTGAIELNYALQGRRNGTTKFRLGEEDISRATNKRFDLCWLDDNTTGATQRFICAIADYVVFYFKFLPPLIAMGNNGIAGMAFATGNRLHDHDK